MASLTLSANSVTLNSKNSYYAQCIISISWSGVTTPAEFYITSNAASVSNINCKFDASPAISSSSGSATQYATIYLTDTTLSSDTSYTLSITATIQNSATSISKTVNVSVSALANSYTIYWKLNTTDTTTNYTTTTVNSGYTITAPSTNPTRSADAQYTYTFKGWGTSSTSTAAITSFSEASASQTYYAIWTKTTRSYTVTFSTSGSGSLNKTSQTVTYGYTGSCTATPSTGYHVSSVSNGSTSTTAKDTAATITSSTVTGAMTVTVTFAVNTWTLTWKYSHCSGSGGTSAGTVSYGATLTKPTLTAATGYHSAAWETVPSTMPNSNATYTATATANTFTVTFNGNGSNGGSTATETFTYDVAKTLTANGFTRAYTVTFNANGGSCSTASSTATYTFKNWNTNSGGTGTTYTNQQSVSNLTSTNGGNINLYAQWTSASVTLPTPSRTGYTFNGWYSGSSKIGNAGASYTPSADITLTASWTEHQYTIKFNNTSTSNCTTSGSVADKTLKYTDSYTLPANGYSRYVTVTFNATANSGSVSPTSSTATSDGTVWWNDSSGGSQTAAGTSVSKLTSTSGGTYNYYVHWTGGTTTLPTPTKTGYTFSKWSTASSGGTQVTSSTIFSVSTTIYAQFTARTDITYKVKDWLQTLSAAQSSSSTQNSTNYTLTETHTYTDGTADASKTITVASHTGFTSPSAQTVTIAADGSTVVNYYYTRNGYTLTWNANSGSISGMSPSTGTVYYGTSITAPTSKSRTGYTFKDYTVMIGDVNNNGVIPSTMPYTSVTVTANWTPISGKYQVVENLYNNAGDTLLTYDISVNYDTANQTDYGSPGAWHTNTNSSTYSEQTGTTSTGVTLTAASKTGFTFWKWLVTSDNTNFTQLSTSTPYTWTTNYATSSTKYTVVAAYKRNIYNLIPVVRAFKWPELTDGWTANWVTGTTSTESSSLAQNYGYYHSIDSSTSTYAVQGGKTGGFYTVEYNCPIEITRDWGFAFPEKHYGGNIYVNKTASATYDSGSSIVLIEKNSNDKNKGYRWEQCTVAANTSTASPGSFAMPYNGDIYYFAVAHNRQIYVHFDYTTNGITNDKSQAEFSRDDTAFLAYWYRPVNINGESLPTVTKPYYTFNGWYNQSSGGSKITPTTTILDAYSGDYLYNIPTYETSGGDPYFILYAQYTTNTYTIKFNKNYSSASGSMADLSFTFEDSDYSSKTITANSFTRGGYHFDHWNTKSDDSGTSYANNANINSFPANTSTDTTSTTINLYAIWKPNSGTLSVPSDNIDLRNNAGTTVLTINTTLNDATRTSTSKPSVSDVSITTDTSVSITAPDVTGFTFNSWYYPSSVSNDGVYTWSTKSGASNKTLTFTPHLASNGGTMSIYLRYNRNIHTLTWKTAIYKNNQSTTFNSSYLPSSITDYAYLYTNEDAGASSISHNIEYQCADSIILYVNGSHWKYFGSSVSIPTAIDLNDSNITTFSLINMPDNDKEITIKVKSLLYTVSVNVVSQRSNSATDTDTGGTYTLSGLSNTSTSQIDYNYPLTVKTTPYIGHHYTKLLNSSVSVSPWTGPNSSTNFSDTTVTYYDSSKTNTMYVKGNTVLDAYFMCNTVSVYNYARYYNSSTLGGGLIAVLNSHSTYTVDYNHSVSIGPNPSSQSEGTYTVTGVKYRTESDSNYTYHTSSTDLGPFKDDGKNSTSDWVSVYTYLTSITHTVTPAVVTLLGGTESTVWDGVSSTTKHNNTLKITSKQTQSSANASAGIYTSTAIAYGDGVGNMLPITGDYNEELNITYTVADGFYLEKIVTPSSTTLDSTTLSSVDPDLRVGNANSSYTAIFRAGKYSVANDFVFVDKNYKVTDIRHIHGLSDNGLLFFIRLSALTETANYAIGISTSNITLSGSTLDAYNSSLKNNSSIIGFATVELPNTNYNADTTGQVAIKLNTNIYANVTTYNTIYVTIINLSNSSITNSVSRISLTRSAGIQYYNVIDITQNLAKDNMPTHPSYSLTINFTNEDNNRVYRGYAVNLISPAVCAEGYQFYGVYGNFGNVIKGETNYTTYTTETNKLSVNSTVSSTMLNAAIANTTVLINEMPADNTYVTTILKQITKTATLTSKAFTTSSFSTDITSKAIRPADNYADYNIQGVSCITTAKPPQPSRTQTFSNINYISISDSSAVSNTPGSSNVVSADCGIGNVITFYAKPENGMDFDGFYSTNDDTLLATGTYVSDTSNAFYGYFVWGMTMPGYDVNIVAKFNTRSTNWHFNKLHVTIDGATHIANSKMSTLDTTKLWNYETVSIDNTSILPETGFNFARTRVCSFGSTTALTYSELQTQIDNLSVPKFNKNYTTATSSLNYCNGVCLWEGHPGAHFTNMYVVFIYYEITYRIYTQLIAAHSNDINDYPGYRITENITGDTAFVDDMTIHTLVDKTISASDVNLYDALGVYSLTYTYCVSKAGGGISTYGVSYTRPAQIVTCVNSDSINANTIGTNITDIYDCSSIVSSIDGCSYLNALSFNSADISVAVNASKGYLHISKKNASTGNNDGLQTDGSTFSGDSWGGHDNEDLINAPYVMMLVKFHRRLTKFTIVNITKLPNSSDYIYAGDNASTAFSITDNKYTNLGADIYDQYVATTYQTSLAHYYNTIGDSTSYYSVKDGFEPHRNDIQTSLVINTVANTLPTFTYVIDKASYYNTYIEPIICTQVNLATTSYGVMDSTGSYYYTFEAGSIVNIKPYNGLNNAYGLMLEYSYAGRLEMNTHSARTCLLVPTESNNWAVQINLGYNDKLFASYKYKTITHIVKIIKYKNDGNIEDVTPTGGTAPIIDFSTTYIKSYVSGNNTKTLVWDDVIKLYLYYIRGYKYVGYAIGKSTPLANTTRITRANEYAATSFGLHNIMTATSIITGESILAGIDTLNEYTKQNINNTCVDNNYLSVVSDVGTTVGIIGTTVYDYLFVGRKKYNIHVIGIAFGASSGAPTTWSQHIYENLENSAEFIDCEEFINGSASYYKDTGLDFYADFNETVNLSSSEFTVPTMFGANFYCFVLCDTRKEYSAMSFTDFANSGHACFGTTNTSFTTKYSSTSQDSIYCRIPDNDTNPSYDNTDLYLYIIYIYSTHKVHYYNLLCGCTNDLTSGTSSNHALPHNLINNSIYLTLSPEYIENNGILYNEDVLWPQFNYNSTIYQYSPNTTYYPVTAGADQSVNYKGESSEALKLYYLGYNEYSFLSEITTWPELTAYNPTWEGYEPYGYLATIMSTVNGSITSSVTRTDTSGQTYYWPLSYEMFNNYDCTTTASQVYNASSMYYTSLTPLTTSSELDSHITNNTTNEIASSDYKLYKHTRTENTVIATPIWVNDLSTAKIFVAGGDIMIIRTYKSVPHNVILKQLNFNLSGILTSINTDEFNHTYYTTYNYRKPVYLEYSAGSVENYITSVIGTVITPHYKSPIKNALGSGTTTFRPLPDINLSTECNTTYTFLNSVIYTNISTTSSGITGVDYEGLTAKYKSSDTIYKGLGFVDAINNGTAINTLQLSNIAYFNKRINYDSCLYSFESTSDEVTEVYPEYSDSKVSETAKTLKYSLPIMPTRDVYMYNIYINQGFWIFKFVDPNNYKTIDGYADNLKCISSNSFIKLKNYSSVNNILDIQYPGSDNIKISNGVPYYKISALNLKYSSVSSITVITDPYKKQMSITQPAYLYIKGWDNHALYQGTNINKNSDLIKNVITKLYGYKTYEVDTESLTPESVTLSDSNNMIWVNSTNDSCSMLTVKNDMSTGGLYNIDGDTDNIFSNQPTGFTFKNYIATSPNNNPTKSEYLIDNPTVNSLAVKPIDTYIAIFKFISKPRNSSTSTEGTIITAPCTSNTFSINGETFTVTPIFTNSDGEVVSGYYIVRFDNLTTTGVTTIGHCIPPGEFIRYAEDLGLDLSNSTNIIYESTVGLFDKTKWTGTGALSLDNLEFENTDYGTTSALGDMSWYIINSKLYSSATGNITIQEVNDTPHLFINDVDYESYVNKILLTPGICTFIRLVNGETNMTSTKGEALVISQEQANSCSLRLSYTENGSTVTLTSKFYITDIGVCFVKFKASDLEAMIDANIISENTGTNSEACPYIINSSSVTINISATIRSTSPSSSTIPSTIYLSFTDTKDYVTAFENNCSSFITLVYPSCHAYTALSFTRDPIEELGEDCTEPVVIKDINELSINDPYIEYKSLYNIGCNDTLKSSVFAYGGPVYVMNAAATGASTKTIEQRQQYANWLTSSSTSLAVQNANIGKYLFSNKTNEGSSTSNGNDNEYNNLTSLYISTSMNTYSLIGGMLAGEAVSSNISSPIFFEYASTLSYYNLCWATPESIQGWYVDTYTGEILHNDTIYSQASTAQDISFNASTESFTDTASTIINIDGYGERTGISNATYCGDFYDTCYVLASESTTSAGTRYTKKYVEFVNWYNSQFNDITRYPKYTALDAVSTAALPNECEVQILPVADYTGGVLMYSGNPSNINNYDYNWLCKTPVAAQNSNQTLDTIASTPSDLGGLSKGFYIRAHTKLISIDKNSNIVFKSVGSSLEPGDIWFIYVLSTQCYGLHAGQVIQFNTSATSGSALVSQPLNVGIDFVSGTTSIKLSAATATCISVYDNVAVSDECEIKIKNSAKNNNDGKTSSLFKDSNFAVSLTLYDTAAEAIASANANGGHFERLWYEGHNIKSLRSTLTCEANDFIPGIVDNSKHILQFYSYIGNTGTSDYPTDINNTNYHILSVMKPVYIETLVLTRYSDNTQFTLDLAATNKFGVYISHFDYSGIFLCAGGTHVLNPIVNLNGKSSYEYAKSHSGSLGSITKYTSSSTLYNSVQMQQLYGSSNLLTDIVKIKHHNLANETSSMLYHTELTPFITAPNGYRNKYSMNYGFINNKFKSDNGLNISGYNMAPNITTASDSEILAIYTSKNSVIALDSMYKIPQHLSALTKYYNSTTRLYESCAVNLDNVVAFSNANTLKNYINISNIYLDPIDYVSSFKTRHNNPEISVASVYLDENRTKAIPYITNGLNYAMFTLYDKNTTYFPGAIYKAASTQHYYSATLPAQNGNATLGDYTGLYQQAFIYTPGYTDVPVSEGDFEIALCVDYNSYENIRTMSGTTRDTIFYNSAYTPEFQTLSVSLTDANDFFPSPASYAGCSISEHDNNYSFIYGTQNQTEMYYNDSKITVPSTTDNYGTGSKILANMVALVNKAKTALGHDTVGNYVSGANNSTIVKSVYAPIKDDEGNIIDKVRVHKFIYYDKPTLESFAVNFIKVMLINCYADSIKNVKYCQRTLHLQSNVENETVKNTSTVIKEYCYKQLIPMYNTSTNLLEDTKDNCGTSKTMYADISSKIQTIMRRVLNVTFNTVLTEENIINMCKSFITIIDNEISGIDHRVIYKIAMALTMYYIINKNISIDAYTLDVLNILWADILYKEITYNGYTNHRFAFLPGSHEVLTTMTTAGTIYIV